MSAPGPDRPGLTRLYLVRHGAVEGPGNLNGHTDVALTPAGLAQMERAAERLAGEHLAAVFSSDLRRAREGAELIARGRGIGPVADPAFRELHMGRWDGRPFTEVWESEAELVERWWADPEGFETPGGESLGQLRSRVLPALDAILRRHAGRTVCLVAHGGVNRVVLFEALGLSLSCFQRLAQDHGCLNLVEYPAGGEPVVRLVNG